MSEWLTRALGGRPMSVAGFAFTDRVTGLMVFYWRDRLGRKWLANGAWSLFRVEVTTANTNLGEQG